MNRRKFLKLLSTGALAYSAQGFFAFNANAAIADNNSYSFLKGAPKYTIADSHFHYVDFIQRTEGAEALLKAMNANGVEHIMMSGMPLVKKWDKDDPIAPEYYLDNNSRTYWYSGTDYHVAQTVEKIPDEERHRFHPYICGFNPTDKYAVDHVKRMYEAFPNLWHGVGEIFAHRDDLTNLTYGETARANHEALDAVYDFAADHDLPVCLHNNCTSRNKLKDPIYVYEVEDVLKRHPNTRLTWAHAGLSRYLNVDQGKYTAKLGAMLDKHPSLWIDLSWIAYNDYITDGGSTFTVKPCWLDLIKSFPDKFMIGSDTVGQFKGYAMEIRKYYSLLDALPSDVALKVAKGNFLSILPQRVQKDLAKRKN
ncbi:amidohydrolase family protein [Maridesulfovibrio frigidus]|uniref:amidohydrolase family protein n=1 Tax=Maridesulfovibrio frigidus TaxID=340956 RepID=UPI0004E2378F|nr:amidohydrolase family protein [Maridesulfovibrio frigidus]